ncbi:Hypothetical predicted protein, partial [Paramuricea clavata]
EADHETSKDSQWHGLHVHRSGYKIWPHHHQTFFVTKLFFNRIVFLWNNLSPIIPMLTLYTVDQLNEFYNVLAKKKYICITSYTTLSNLIQKHMLT